MKRLFRLFSSLIILSAFLVPFATIEPVEATFTVPPSRVEPVKASSTLIVYSSSSDVYALGVNTTYNTARTAVSATQIVSNPSLLVGQYLDATANYTIWRGFLYFDTSEIPDTALITSATLDVYAAAPDLSDTDFEVVVQTGNNTYPNDPFIDSDYNYNLYADNFSSVNTASFNTTGYKSFSLNAVGVATVNVTGTTKFVLRSSKDIDGIAPTGIEAVWIYSSLTAGTDFDPRLTIVYELATDIVQTNDATEILPTTATLQAELLSTGNQSYVGVFFEYGSSTSYGTTTLVQNVTTIGTFIQDISYLQYNQTYHFRAIAKIGSVYFYGQDYYFTTMPAVGSTTDMRIVSVAVFSDYQTSGDLLFVAEIINNYTGYYPNADPKKYFTIQLLDTNNTDILGATPLQNWGDRPVSIYINAADAGNFTDLAGYYIRMVLNPATGNASISYQLEIDDWSGFDLGALDDWCRGTAINMQLSDGRADYLTSTTDQGLQITDAAGGYFTTGIPNITLVRPNLFTTSQRQSLTEVGVADNQWDKTDLDPAGWRSYVGANIADDIDAIAVPFGLDGKEIAVGIVLFAMFAVVITTVGATGGWGALGAVLIAIPVLWIGIWFRIIPIWVLIILVIGFGYFYVRQFHWKTL